MRVKILKFNLTNVACTAYQIAELDVLTGGERETERVEARLGGSKSSRS